MSSLRRAHIGLAFALMMLTVTGSVARAQSLHPTPAPLLPVVWGAKSDSVVAQATRAGWTFSQVDGDGDYAFQGKIGDVDAVAFASFGPNGGLTRVLISVTPHPFAPLTYRQLSDTLRSHYGFARLGGEYDDAAPAASMHWAAAWPGILLGLRRDGWITMVFTCPESSPKLPALRSRVVSA